LLGDHHGDRKSTEGIARIEESFTRRHRKANRTFAIYISRVENGHTVPAIETLEKMARSLEVPMYRLFHAGEVPAGLSKMKPPKDDEFGSKGREADYFSKLRRLLGA
jgi:transcriptional regulator with XRE-family HTH domain